MKNIPPPRRHRNGCTVTTTFTKSSISSPFFCVGVASFERSPPKKRSQFRLKNVIRKSSSSLPSKNHPLKRVIELFSITRENKDHANVATVNSKCFPYARNLFQRFLRSEIAERTLA